MVRLMFDLLRKIVRYLRAIKSQKYSYKIGNMRNHNTNIDSLVPQFVEIGNNFISAPGSIILAHDASLLMHNHGYRVEKTIIGDNVFIGANAVVMPGVSIGDGAIVGAGAVVTKSVPPGVVVAGNPARVLSTVADYYEKCVERGVFVSAPPAFFKLKEGLNLNNDDLDELRAECDLHWKK